MRTLLAKLNCLPRLVGGKVIIINDDNTYSAYTPSKYCTIEDNFNPVNYCLLKTDKYVCVIHSNNEEIETYLVHQQLRELSMRKYLPVRVGDRIHIHSRQGIYTIHEIHDKSLVITCNKWRHTKHKYVEVDFKDFKCLAGGINNTVFE